MWKLERTRDVMLVTREGHARNKKVFVVKKIHECQPLNCEKGGKGGLCRAHTLSGEEGTGEARTTGPAG